MASLKSQLEKANTDLNRAGYVRDAALSLREDTRYVKFENRPQSEKNEINNKIREASKKYNTAKAYYDKILAAYNKELENKKITGQKEGLSEEDQAADLGISVEEYRKQKQTALDADQAARDAASQGAANQQEVATFSQFLNTISVDEVQLKAVQQDLKKNFPSIYKGGTNGLKDWTSTQSALQTIAETRGALPKTLQGASLREFLLNPTVSIGSTGAAGPTTDRSANIFTDAEAIAVVQKLYKTLLNAEPTPEEQLRLAKKLQNAQKKNPIVTKYKTTGGVRESVTTGGLDAEEFLTNEIKKDNRYSKKQEQTLASSRAILAATARANALDLDANFGNQVDDFLNRIKNGEDIRNIQNLIRQQGRLFLPENVRNAIDPTIDLSSALSIYMNRMAKSKGVSVDQIDVNEVIPLAITDKGFASISDFNKGIRKLSWWPESEEAIDAVYQGVGQVFGNFGVMEI
jgi:hypothetical protein